jgi:hypothetical protein
MRKTSPETRDQLDAKAARMAKLRATEKKSEEELPQYHRSFKPIREPRCKEEQNLDRVYRGVIRLLNRGIPHEEIRRRIEQQNKMRKMLPYTLLTTAINSAFETFGDDIEGNDFLTSLDSAAVLEEKE